MTNLTSIERRIAANVRGNLLVGDLATVALQVGLSRSHLYRRYTAEVAWSLPELERLAAAIGTEVDVFLSPRVGLAPRPDPVTSASVSTGGGSHTRPRPEAMSPEVVREVSLLLDEVVLELRYIASQIQDARDLLPRRSAVRAVAHPEMPED